jgi:hypothetical protein
MSGAAARLQALVQVAIEAQLTVGKRGQEAVE